MKPLKERKRRRLLHQAAERLAKIHEKKTPAAEEEKPAPQSGTLSHEKPASSRAVRYNPMTAPRTRMTDTRGVPYDIGPKGQLSRVRPKIQRTARVEKIREGFRESRKGKKNGTAGEKV